MSFDLGSLEPRIYQILSAPGTDLTTISAKRVRRQLLDLDPSLTAEFLKENKEEVDAIIASVFEKVSGGAHTSEAPTSNGNGAGSANPEKPYRKRKQDDDNEDSVPDEDEEDDAGIEDASPPPKKPKKASKNGRELSDAELARKLSSEINGRSTRTGGKARSSGTTKKGVRTKKSSATVDSDDNSDDATKKKKSSSGAKGGFAKEFALSPPLAALLQVDKLARPQVVKQLWVYIKGNDLQNPENRREIMCDPNLRAVFGVDKINMFKMNKVLGSHLHEIE